MSDKTAGGAAPAPADRPRRVSAAAVLCGLQGAVITVLGAVMLVLTVTGDPGDRDQALAGAVTALALGVLPLAAGHGLWRLRRWSRGPAVIVQLLGLPVAWTLLGSGGLWPLAAVGLAATALAVLACLINPTATEALGIGPREA
ncbi:hypothetical protein [Streptomyces avicenniae]|uniref:hypothetical protein n=1 Tax=Streptomyces avicenniae TaxID=500153 RepID=UPI0006995CDC|nr:hypothetical protein [Streptomyces avicenniae]